MKLTWNIDHTSYRQAQYEVWRTVMIFEIDYLESTDQYLVRINGTEYWPLNTYREAQIRCDAFLEWMLEFQYKIKHHLSDLLDD